MKLKILHNLFVNYSNHVNYHLPNIRSPSGLVCDLANFGRVLLGKTENFAGENPQKASGCTIGMRRVRTYILLLKIGFIQI